MTEVKCLRKSQLQISVTSRAETTSAQNYASKWQFLWFHWQLMENPLYFRMYSLTLLTSQEIPDSSSTHGRTRPGLCPAWQSPWAGLSRPSFSSRLTPNRLAKEHGRTMAWISSWTNFSTVSLEIKGHTFTYSTKTVSFIKPLSLGPTPPQLPEADTEEKPKVHSPAGNSRPRAA